RKRFHALERTDSRVFIAHRISAAPVTADGDEMKANKHFLLEAKHILVAYQINGEFPLVPSCNTSDMVRVCRRFFQWVLQCSHNKIDQPTLKLASSPSKVPYSITVQGSRLNHAYDDSTAA